MFEFIYNLIKNYFFRLFALLRARLFGAWNTPSSELEADPQDQVLMMRRTCSMVAQELLPMSQMLLESFDDSSLFWQFLKENENAYNFARKLSKAMSAYLYGFVPGTKIWQYEAFKDALVHAQNTKGFSLHHYLLTENYELAECIHDNLKFFQRLHKAYSHYRLLNPEPIKPFLHSLNFKPLARRAGPDEDPQPPSDLKANNQYRI